MQNRTVLAGAIAAALGAAGPADAAIVSVLLQSVVANSANGTSAANISSSTATWTYNSFTGQLTQQGGLFNARFGIGQTTTLYRQSATGLVVGGGAAAAATSYACTEGNFGSGVGASICGNYYFGANFVNDSALSYGPGTAVSRTLGGDDVALGSPQGVGTYDGMTQVSWAGTTLKLSNATATGGYTWTLKTLAAVPPPPAPGFTVIMSPGGIASGIDNLEIMGTRYDVRFACYPGSNPPCALGPGRDLFLGNHDGAIAAADAIAGALTSAGAVDVGNFSLTLNGDWTSYLVPYSGTQGIRGCSPALACLGVYGGGWLTQEATYAPPPPGADPAAGQYYPGAYGDYTLVSFTPTAVPLPAAGWLFGSALAGLRWVKRRAGA